MTKAFFITSPGTENGKTTISAALVAQLVADGYKVGVLKPVISGWDDFAVEDTDTGILLRASGEEVTDVAIERVSPWRFVDPVSPDIAAARAGVSLSVLEIVHYIAEHIAASDCDYICVEGAGGLMTPVDKHSTMLDVIALLSLPVIVVSDVYLGAIGHSLMCATLLKHVQPDLLQGIVVNEVSSLPGVHVDEMLGSLQSHLSRQQIVHVPHILSPEGDVWQHVPRLNLLSSI